MTYNSRKGEICFLGSISNILHYYGEPISEGTLLAKCAGYDFRINFDEASFPNNLCLECVSFRDSDYDNLSCFLKKRGYKINYYEFSNKDELYDILFMKLSNGIPAMICTDMYNLPYHSQYRKMHFEHIVVIHSLKQNMVSLSDCCPSIINKPYYDGIFTKDDFLLILYKNPFYRIWFIERNNSNNERTVKALKQSDNILQLSYSGTNAIRRLSELYKNLTINSILSNEVREQLRYHYCLFSGFGGPVVTRRLYRDYLIELKYKELASECLDLANQWNIKSKYLIRTVVLSDMDFLLEFSSSLKELANYEKAFMNKIKWIN